MFDKLALIKKAVAQANSLPNPHIEYNFDGLPEDENVTATSFYGIPARYNPNRQINTINVIRKFQ